MNAPASRRSFLRGFAALSAGAAALVAPAALAKPPEPDRELIDLGADLDAAAAAYQKASEHVTAAVACFKAMEPAIPDALRMRGFNGWVATDWPPDAFGGHTAAHVENRIRIPARYALDEVAKRIDGRTVTGRLARRTKKVSDEFHAAHEAAREAAGVPAASTARFFAGRAVIDLGFKIAAVRASSLAGLAVHGRVGLATDRVWTDDGGVQIGHGQRLLLLNLASLDGREEASLCA